MILTSSPSTDTPEPAVAAPDGLVGRSRAFRDAVSAGMRLIREGAPIVALVGEAGTGKELLARAMHARARDAHEPFLVADCASIPARALEADLFGRDGDVGTLREDQRGLLEIAGSGTVLITAMAEFPLWLQPALHRAASERRLRRIGGMREVGVRSRIVLALNEAPDAMVERGRMRRDLAEALRSRTVQLPPLRDRIDDIPVIADHFLTTLAEQTGEEPKSFAPAAVAKLRAHPWPGNIRELRSVVERAAALAVSDMIGDAHLTIRHRLTRAAAASDEIAVAEIRIPSSGKPLAEIEREAIVLTLQLHRGNQSATARTLGIARPTLARKIREYGLRPASD
jgi:DNA-binding NtrC family response regulator